jgi:hypothetical protein
MDYANLDHFFKSGKHHLKKGPIALIFAEDEVELASTILHHTKLGFMKTIIFSKSMPALPTEVQDRIAPVYVDLFNAPDVSTIINKISTLTSNQWIYFCYNAEYLFFPFCETRSIAELLNFHSEERRAAMLTYVVDIYFKDPLTSGEVISRNKAQLDKAGYFATARVDPKTHQPMDHQLDFFGGLRWRFEEYVPYSQRKIDRISIFKASKGLNISKNYTFNNQEYNTYACRWHNNLTAAIISFRAAKALMNNPNPKSEIKDLFWEHSTPFKWQSSQLLDLGLIEPGQWF